MRHFEAAIWKVVIMKISFENSVDIKNLLRHTLAF